MSKNNNLYDFIKNKKVSQSCNGAAFQYIKAINDICPIVGEVSHSILRIFLRPLFYLGYSDIDEILNFVEQYKNEYFNFYNWILGNKCLIELCIKELEICSLFYDIDYDINRKLLILDNDKIFYKELEFKNYFCDKLKLLGISDLEIDRIYYEEFENKIFV